MSADLATLVEEIYGPGDRRRRLAIERKQAEQAEYYRSQGLTPPKRRKYQPTRASITTPNRRGRPRVRTRRPLPQSNNLAWFKPVVKVDDHPFIERRSFDPQRARIAAIRAAGLEDDE